VTFDNDANLTAVWPVSEAEDDEDQVAPFFFVRDHLGRVPLRPSDVKKAFPTLGVIPVLGPLERRERELEPSYVRQNQEGRLASRHYRNQLYRLKFDAPVGEYEEFEHYLTRWAPENHHLRCPGASRRKPGDGDRRVLS